MKVENVRIYKLPPGESAVINQLAEWYFDEWKLAKETTLQRFNVPSPDDVVFHLILEIEGKPISAGGLHLKVGIVNSYERFRKYGPWVGMVYTDKSFRKQGFGEMILNEIERSAKQLGYSKLYLYTNSAEKLYVRNGWQTFEKVIYKEKETVVMSKPI